MRERGLGCALVLTLTAMTPGVVSAQEMPSDTRLTTAHYFDLEQLSDAQISPDGSRIIYARRQVNRIEDKWEPSLWIVNADGSQNRFLAYGDGARWAPDGRRILYIAEVGGQPQVFVRWIDADGPATQVTRGVDKVADARWSPDGKQIAFSMFMADEPKWSISLPPAPKDAKWAGAPRIVQSLHYRQDKVGFLAEGRTHLFLVPADGGAARQLTSGAWSVGAGETRGPVAFDWTPDSKTIVFRAARDFDNDVTRRRAQLLAVHLASGALRELVVTRGDWAKPTVSPDGRWVAFTGHPESTKTYPLSALYVVGMDGGAIRELSKGLDREPINLRWSPDGSGLFFDSNDHGTRNVSFASLKGRVKPLTEGTHVLVMDSISKSGVAAGTLSDPDHPAEIVRYDLRKPNAVAALTHVNASWLEGKTLGHTQELSWTSSGGVRVHGWYVTPPDFDASKKYPLILHIHGGPYDSYNAEFNYIWQNFAANGFVVLYLNPRGSTSYGQAFSDGIDHNYPGPDYDDLMSGVDAVTSKGFVDTARMYVSGCSGGGVLASWIIGHTNRFAAAAVRCPVTNWLSFAGNTDTPLFAYDFFDKPFWENPKPWLEHSPLMYVGQVTTPTLLMTGVLDRRTPMSQTEEYFAALKIRGVPSLLLQFEGEYHGTNNAKPSNWMRTQLYTMSWFKRWTRSSSGAVLDAEKGAEASVGGASSEYSISDARRGF